MGPRRETPQLGTRTRLKRARARLRERKMLLSPGRRGGLGCLMTGLHAATAAGAIVAIGAPCTAGLALGVLGALTGLTLGALIGVPLVLGTTNALKTLALENASATTEKPQLPAGGGGGAETSVAVAPADRRGPG
jgi:hypothetical protein